MPIATVPPLRQWRAPSETGDDVDFAALRTIDLTKFDSEQQEVRDAAFQDFKIAIEEDGFLYLVNFGLSQSEVSLFLCETEICSKIQSAVRVICAECGKED